MKTNWKATLAVMAVVGMVGLQTEVVLGQEVAINMSAAPVVVHQDGSTDEKNVSVVKQETATKAQEINTAHENQGIAVSNTKNAVTPVQWKVTTGSVTFDLTPDRVAEDLAVRKFLQEKKASFVEGDAEDLELVGTSYTAKRIPPLVITDAFVNALREEAKLRVEAKQREPWTFPDVEMLKEKLDAMGKKKTADKNTSDALESDDTEEVGNSIDTVSESTVPTTLNPDDLRDSSKKFTKDTPVETKSVLDSTETGAIQGKDALLEKNGMDLDSTVESKVETKVETKANTSKHNKVDSTGEHTTSSETKGAVADKKDIKDTKDMKQPKAPKYPIDLLWTDKAGIFLHEDVHVGATRGEVLFAWGAPQAMWRDNKDGSLLWLYQGTLGKEKTITKNKKSSMQKEEFSQSVKNTYTSDSLAGSNSSVGYVWLSLKDGKVTHLGMITGQDWPRFAIPATTLETFKPNRMTESDFSLMGYRLGDTFTNDPNRSWEERGKLYGQEFLGYKDVVIAYNKEHEITRVMINSSLGTTKRGISLGDSKYLLLYLYGVPDFEEPANHHDSTKGVVYGYRHPVLEHTYLLFTLDDKFVREILLSDQKKSELVSAM